MALLDGDVDGVGLVAVFGGGIAEANMLLDVVSRAGDNTLAGAVGDGERRVPVVGYDVRQVPVAARLARRGAQLASLRRLATTSPG